MVIDRSKHNKFVGLPEKTTDTRGTTGASGSGSGDRSTTVIIGGGGGTASLDPELIEELRNQEAFSYLNVSDGVNTETAAAKIEKDYINLNFIGDGETSGTQVSSGRHLPETYLEATGTKPGNYNLSYEQIKIPEVVDGEPVETVKWRITLTKVFGDPIFPNTDFNGIELLKDDASLGVYKLTDERVTVTSDDSTGLISLVIMQDEDIDFDKLQLVNQIDAGSEIVTVISEIGIQTYITVLITQDGAKKYWKLDENNKLYTDYDVYTNKTLGAKDMIWSDKGYTVGDFVQGVSGGVFYISDELGTTYIEADKLRVRKKAYFETLEIVNVNTVGGKQIISPGGAITIRKVEEFDDYYRCYFLGKQDDVVVENRFRVDDLAFSQNFNIKSPGEYEQVANHYFWRLVVGVSTDVDADDNHYIDLSKADCDLDSDIPHVNDVVAQLGNRTDTDRQSALIFSSVDIESPRIILCNGISTYTLTATDRFDLGVNHYNNQAYMNVYGNAYIGAKDQSSYMSYSIDNGLSIKGNLDITSTLGGKSFSDVFVTSENFEETVNAVVGDELEYLQNQIDGNIESYFYDYSPTLENYPASEWTDEQTRLRHIGDTFTNIQEYVDDETTPDAGKSWRWVKSTEGVWGWTPIADSDAVLALKKAAEAQDTADGKRRVFVQQPTDMDEYDVGDLWVNATYSDDNVTYDDDLLRAKTSKPKGHPFSIDHWALASNYKNLAQDAINAAEAAGEAANNAQQSIDDYKDEIDNVFQDGIITTSEASRLRTLVDTVNTTLVDAQKTYEEVYNNGALDNKPQKTELASTFSAFDTAADNLIQIVTEIVDKATTQSYTITKADITNVDTAYATFNTKYSDYVIALNAANLEIMNTLSNTAYANAVNAFGWLNGLFDPDQKTTIEGAVVTTGILALGKTLDGVFTVNAGINGVENDSYLGNGIAIWFGGDMIDKDNYSAGQRPANTASSLFRFDGSGYLGYVPNSDASRDEAPIWWDTRGNLHANPLSFFVGEESVGFLLSAFQPVDSNQDGSADYLIQHVPFQTVQIGSAYLGYDAVNKAVYVYTKEADGSNNICNFYATGEVTAYGSSDGADMPKIINYLYELKDVNWGIGSKPSSADTMIMWNGETWLYVSKNDVGLNETQLEQYLTDNEYAKKSDVITNVSWSAITDKPTTLSGYGIKDGVNDISLKGEGNAFTSVSISGHTLTLTKGSTFLLSSAYTADDILEKLKTVDGSGSGLDADTLDGTQKSGLFTALSSSSSTNISITVGGITRNISDLYATTAEKLSTSAGSSVTPVYFSSGKPVSCSYSFGNSSGNAAINNGTLCTNLNADMLDGLHAISDGSGAGVKKVFRFVLHGETSTYIKIGTLLTTSSTGVGSSKVMFTIKGGINFGNTNESIYEVAASTRGYISVTSTLVRGDKQLKVGYVSKSSNVEIWVAYESTYLGVTEIEVSSSINFTLSMTETSSKPNNFVEGSYRVLAATTDNVASATKLQTARTIWGQSFDGTGNVSGSLTGVADIESTGFYLRGYNSQNPYLNLSNDNVSNAYLQLTTSGVLSMDFGAASGKNISIVYSTGNVGIGTTSPSYKLHVAGDILADGYIRTYGATGWLNVSYGGGIFMNDTKHIKLLNNYCLYQSSNRGASVYHRFYNGAVTWDLVTVENTSGVAGTVNSFEIKEEGAKVGIAVRYGTSSNGRLVVRDNSSESSIGYINGSGQRWTAGVGIGITDAFGWWYNPASTWRAYLDANGNFVAVGEITAYSDQRLKSDIQPLVYRGRLNPKSYIKDDKQSIGFIAQEVQELYPELVMDTGGDEHYLALNYGNITAVLSAQINNVEDEVTSLKKRVEELENRLSKYEYV